MSSDGLVHILLILGHLDISHGVHLLGQIETILFENPIAEAVDLGCQFLDVAVSDNLIERLRTH